MSPLFAVHIPDGVLTAPWLAGGFAVAGLLALVGSFRIRDEEIPRIALLTSAFFVASLIHARIGPSSVHLLLNGLVGVILGRRAALAILVGLVLQAALLVHGGLLTVGVNTCVMALPALLAGCVFAIWRPSLPAPSPRTREFALGYLVGAGAVVATAVLNSLVLLWGGAQDWKVLAVFVLLAHLPVAVVEGFIVGFTVQFLARVKPQLLAGADARGQTAWSTVSPAPDAAAQPAAAQSAPQTSSALKLPVALLAAGVLLFGPARSARAHPLFHEYKVVAGKRRVVVETWFRKNESPKESSVQVFRSNGEKLTEVPINDQGVAVFDYDTPDDLRVRLNVPGHPKAFTITRAELEAAEPATTVEEPRPGLEATRPAAAKPADEDNYAQPFADRDRTEVTALRVMLGVGIILALGGLILGLRKAWPRREGVISPPETPPPATPPIGAFRR